MGIASALLLKLYLREESPRREHALDLAGTLALTVSMTLLLAGVGSASTRLQLSLVMGVIGVGLGFMATPYLVAVQNAVPWSRRGVATSATQFFRTIGGAIAVAIFGAMLNTALAPVIGAGMDANSTLEPARRARLDPAQLHALVGGLKEGLHRIFIGFVIVAVPALVISLYFPGGAAGDLAHPAARGRASPPAP